MRRDDDGHSTDIRHSYIRAFGSATYNRGRGDIGIIDSLCDAFDEYTGMRRDDDGHSTDIRHSYIRAFGSATYNRGRGDIGIMLLGTRCHHGRFRQGIRTDPHSNLRGGIIFDAGDVSSEVDLIHARLEHEDRSAVVSMVFSAPTLDNSVVENQGFARLQGLGGIIGQYDHGQTPIRSGVNIAMNIMMISTKANTASAIKALVLCSS